MPRTRRGRGEGSVYQRADGRWCATVSAGYATNGRRRRKTMFGETKQQVQEELARVQMTLLEGTFIAKPTIRATTYASYKQ
jgi:hypothetical protein